MSRKLARYGIKYKVLERRDGPMTMGQADGVRCRTVEIFESFEIGWTADSQPGLSHQTQVTLNQARVSPH
ncbi:hypothetical protein EYZ11_009600 [Aspergillus tanneri]|uniref:FAD-binding domain-containing protein n=1 Tax=Aspergillus tanneri TaxID=1220188 RepID=A0A4S3J7Q3_9EURO|nr:hypothetical protein EYZ11_009600 [Aspergillus tanneri]